MIPHKTRATYLFFSINICFEERHFSVLPRRAAEIPLLLKDVHKLLLVPKLVAHILDIDLACL